MTDWINILQNIMTFFAVLEAFKITRDAVLGLDQSSAGANE
jgi:hypothetical protein